LFLDLGWCETEKISAQDQFFMLQTEPGLAQISKYMKSVILQGSLALGCGSRCMGRCMVKTAVLACVASK
jgi:hypothetical protein